MGVRWYDPKLGRWTQRDPLDQPLEPSGWNPYGYAGGSPVNFIDPTGTFHCPPWDTWRTPICQLEKAGSWIKKRKRKLIYAGAGCLTAGFAGAFWGSVVPFVGTKAGAIGGCVVGAFLGYRYEYVYGD